MQYKLCDCNKILITIIQARNNLISRFIGKLQRKTVNIYILTRHDKRGEVGVGKEEEFYFCRNHSKSDNKITSTRDL